MKQALTPGKPESYPRKEVLITVQKCRAVPSGEMFAKGLDASDCAGALKTEPQVKSQLHSALSFHLPTRYTILSAVHFRFLVTASCGREVLWGALNHSCLVRPAPHPAVQKAGRLSLLTRLTRPPAGPVSTSLPALRDHVLPQHGQNAALREGDRGEETL